MEISGSSSDFMISSNSKIDFTSDNEMVRLQSEILQQSKQIEQYISKVEKSKTEYIPQTVLKSLFALFKSELSLNLSFRKSLVQERNHSEQVSKQINEFLRDVSKTTLKSGSLIHLNDAFSMIQNLQSEFSAAKQKLHDQRENLNTLQEENKALKSDLERVKNQLTSKEGEFSVNQASLLSQIEQLNQEKQQSYFKFIQAQNDITKLNEEIQSLNSTIFQLNNRENLFSKEINDCKNKLAEKEEQINNLQCKLTQASETQSKISSTANPNNEYIEIKKHYQIKKKKYQLKMNSLLEQMKNQYEEQMDSNLNEFKNEKSKFKAYIKNIQEKMAEKDEKITELKAQMSVSHEKQISELQSIIDNQKIQLEKNQKKIEELNHASEELNSSHEIYNDIYNQLEKLQKKFSKVSKLQNEKIIDLISGKCESNMMYKESLEQKNNQMKATEIDLRYQIEDLTSENRRLKQQLRQMSITLEEEEAELSSLQIALQLRKRRSHR